MILWVPGHSDIEGNELVDAVVKLAITQAEDPMDITFGITCAKIRATVRDDISSHERMARVYAKFSVQKEAEVKSRYDQVLLARIRTAHHWYLESYHQVVDKKT